MAHIIERAKSGRSRCRTCREPIAKDELRFGEEVLDQFGGGGTTHVWHHLLCAAKKKPAELKATLPSFAEEIPDRAALDRTIEESIKTAKPSTFPYAERAPSGRSKCLACGEAIEKGDVRIAVEREVDTGSFQTTGAGYLHVGCAREFTGDEELLAKIKANTPGLAPDALAELEAGL